LITVTPELTNLNPIRELNDELRMQQRRREGVELRMGDGLRGDEGIKGQI